MGRIMVKLSELAVGTPIIAAIKSKLEKARLVQYLQALAGAMTELENVKQAKLLQISWL